MGSLNEIISGKANREKKSGMKRGNVVMLPIGSLVPNEDNRKSFGDRETRNIDLLAEELLISGRVLENLVVRKLPEQDRYLILSGHRRYYASQKNVQDGHAQFSELPCEITDESDAMSYFNLLITNLATEPLTEYERMTSTMHLKEILPELLADDDLRGRRLRERIAETLHISQTKVAQYENISNNLTDQAMELFEQERMNVSVANDLAGLPDDVQEELVRDNVVPAASDVKAVKQELKILRSYDQMSDAEKRETALIFDDLLIHSDFKNYRDALDRMSAAYLSSADGSEAELLSREKYAAEIASMLLHYRGSRTFTGRDASICVSSTRRVLLSHFNVEHPTDMELSYSGFFHAFCEIYRGRIMEQGQTGEAGEQMHIGDYDREDPYEQIIPQPGSCDGKCFHCRNIACDAHTDPRDKCIYFNRLDCTTVYAYEKLKKDFPDLYEKCTGCCMQCPVSDACPFACDRKDMFIIKARAGIREEESDQPKGAAFSISREEEVLGLQALMSQNSQRRAYLMLQEVAAYELVPERFTGKDGVFDTLSSKRDPNEIRDRLDHARWISAEVMERGRFKVVYAYGELGNTIEQEYDARSAVHVLHRAVALDYYGDENELRCLRRRPLPEEVHSFLDSYEDWVVMADLPQIGATYHRALFESGEQLVAVAYDTGVPGKAKVVFYYFTAYSKLEDQFYAHETSEDELIEILNR